jgi:hypothetical protein
MILQEKLGLFKKKAIYSLYKVSFGWKNSWFFYGYIYNSSSLILTEEK